MDFHDEGDGGGWVLGADGSRRWGLYGAAGLLLRAPGADEPYVLLQHRAKWTASGGTWALPGGAIDSHEDAEQAAVRETHEEAGIAPQQVRVRGGWITSRVSGLPRPRQMVHGRPHVGGLPAGFSEDAAVDWTYTTVHADCAECLDTVPNGESVELRWVPQSEVAAMPLMPAFADAWPSLVAPVATLLLDVANIVGARGAAPAPEVPWWRDREAATADLLGRVAAQFPRTMVVGEEQRALWVSRPVAVVEGEAAAVGGGAAGAAGVAGGGGAAGAAEDDAVPDIASALDVVAAPGTADDEIAARAAALAPDHPLFVVTSDRGLRERLPSHARIIGAGEFLRLLGIG